jgi:protein-S-isoprenylcysteine O-methyltransferase Ste14
MTVVLMSTEEKWLANLYGKEYDEYNTTEGQRR